LKSKHKPIKFKRSLDYSYILYICKYTVVEQFREIGRRGWGRVRVVVFNTTFNNISVISWQSVLLVEKTGENH
jgi:hypothetical protein